MSELTIENLCCVADVEAAVGAIPGVRRASVDLARGVLRVEGVADGGKIASARRCMRSAIAWPATACVRRRRSWPIRPG
jgi:copper chaperone CopZ